MPSRIGSEALFRSQLSYLQRIQNRQYLVDEQISTGFKSQTFAGVASDAGTIISSSAMMAKIDQYNRNITIATNRMKLMDTSLSAIDKSISTLNGYLAQLSDSKTPPDVPTLAKDLLNQVTDFLNLNDGERYLFAGSNVSTAPVKTLSAGGGVAPTVPAVPAFNAATNPTGTLFRTNSQVIPLTNYDAATNTYFRPDPDNPTVLQAYKADLPPLTSIELARTPGTTVNIEAGRVIEGTNGARARVMYHTAGAGNSVRAYIEPLNEVPFLPNDDFTVKDLSLSGAQYVENTPANSTATNVFRSIGSSRNANVDTQSVQINGALPTNLRPGVLVDIGGVRFNISEIEPSPGATSNAILKLRPLVAGTSIASTGATRAIQLVTGPNATDVTPSGVGTAVVAGGVELVGPVADYRTDQPAGVGSTGYYTNSQGAREILNPQKVQVTDNATVDYGISADKPAFARLIYTLNFLQQQSSPLNKDDVAAASKILVEARTQITSLRASSGINQKTLLGITEQNTLQKSIANNNFDDLAKQDKTEAIATLTSLQTILEASYNSFARIQDLNLQSFLR